MYCIIMQNVFKFNFAQQGSAIALQLDSNNVMMYGNIYQNNFALKGTTLFATTVNGKRSTVQIINETITNSFTVDQGAITINSENSNVLSIYVINSTFKDCYATNGGSIYGSNIATVVVQTSKFSFTSLVNATNITAVIAPQYSPLNFVLYDLANLTFLNNITSSVTY